MACSILTEDGSMITTEQISGYTWLTIEVGEEDEQAIIQLTPDEVILFIEALSGQCKGELPNDQH